MADEDKAQEPEKEEAPPQPEPVGGEGQSGALPPPTSPDAPQSGEGDENFGKEPEDASAS